MYQELPKTQEMGRYIVEDLYIEVSEKYESFSLKTAEKLYLNLLVNSRPNVIERIPQYIIASYLGISTEAPSRIKKRTTKKKDIFLNLYHFFSGFFFLYD
jgi:hypothetical protein|tara:strand:- start:5661 stop:5960 length:300 start_codon:yes stop_codon:yes gene_type:complete